MTIGDRSVDRALLRVGITAWIVALTLTVAAMWLVVSTTAPSLPNRFGLTSESLVGFSILGITCTSVALVILLRLPRNLVAWLMLGIGLSYAVAALGVARVFDLAARSPSTDLPATAWWASAAIQLAGVLTFFFIFAYPDQRPGSRRKALIAAAVLAAPVVGVLVIALHPGSLFLWPGIDNPIGVGPRFVVDMSGDQAAIPAFLVIAWGGAAAWIAWRYRRSRGVERLQLKWFVSAAVVSVGALVYLTLTAAGRGAGTNWVPGVLYALTTTLVPVAVGIAILRYRLYAIDRLVNRVVVYSAVTVLLAGTYVAIVATLGEIFRLTFAGAVAGETIIVALSTLIVAGLFQPLRRRVQAAVDRRFYRARYDAARTVDVFAGRLRQTIDLEQLEAEMLDVVRLTLRPTLAGLWLGRDR